MTKGVWDRPTLVDKKFNRLLVISEAGRTEKNNRLWNCRCECGKVQVATTSALQRGLTKSCGCLQREKWHKTLTKHGRADTVEYILWKAMKQRSHNPNHKDYADYGGRGIFVCQEWQDSFQSFFDHMGARPKKNDSIERVDHNKGYEPGNCIWLDKRLQNRNKRSNVMITYSGKTMCLTEWCEVLGLSYDTIQTRRRKGITAPEEIFAPPNTFRYGRRIKNYGHNNTEKKAGAK